MITIIKQPSENKYLSAYRPIIIEADITGSPPVAYCDVYLDGVYYKTFSKTQTPFVFDIKDALQEYLQKPKLINGGDKLIINNAVQVYCKIRSSQIIDELIEPDTPIPVQSTGKNEATSGGGTQSNSFYVINSVQQHWDNQDLEVHLNSYKQGNWDGKAYPLTHRPKEYFICRNDSDYFPIISTTTPTQIRLNHRSSPSEEYSQITRLAYCPVKITSFTVTKLDTHRFQFDWETEDNISPNFFQLFLSNVYSAQNVNGSERSYTYTYDSEPTGIITITLSSFCTDPNGGVVIEGDRKIISYDNGIPSSYDGMGGVGELPDPDPDPEPSSVPILVSNSGFSRLTAEDRCSSWVTGGQSLYTTSTDIVIGNRLYYDEALSVIFVGDGNWYGLIEPSTLNRVAARVDEYGNILVVQIC